MLRPLSILVLGLLAAAPARAADFRVGPIVARPGESASGLIPVPAGVDRATEIPVTVVHGAEPGPVLGLVAGNHGYEYPPILALQRLRELVDPARLRGTLVLVHVANVPSFLGRTVYVSPVDGENLNRMYPGKPDGTVSQRIAHAITTEVIDRSDVVVDVHGGDGNESLRPFVYMPVTGDAGLDESIREMTLHFGLDHIVVDRDRPTDPANPIYCDRTAISRGKPAITVESGYLGTRDDASVQILVDGLTSLMRHLNMLDGEPLQVEHPVFLEPTRVLTAPATGVLFPHVERGQWVAEGTAIATLTDFFGEHVAEVRAPFAGVVLYVVGTPPISEGEPVGMIGAPAGESSRRR